MFEQPLIRQIRSRSKELQNVSDDELREISLAQKYIAQTSKKSRKLLSDCFSLVVESCRRHLGQIHYDVQLQCGVQMSKGHIAEMKTGEGKTLTSTLINYWLALQGKGVHVVTFNDYLAQRDADFLRPVYNALGLSVSVLKEKLPEEQKVAAYRSDLTYGSAKEFGFDFLRDRLTQSRTGNDNSGVMRGTHFAVIDEADSILIDEARTPLIIGMNNESEEQVVQQCYRWAASHASAFIEDVDFRYIEQNQIVQLSNQGIKKLRNLPQNEGTLSVSIRELYEFIQDAIKVQRDFHCDKNYAVIEGRIVILDEYTGRPAEGRQWQHGIHQAVEAKEGVEISPATRSAASITIQSYFSRYHFFCGMTGTAWTSRNELKKVYRKRVVRIPTHRPIQRKNYGPKVFTSIHQKFEYIARETNKLIKDGRSVLVGTRSVLQSELLSTVLDAHAIKHDVLNAKFLEREAELVSLAGCPGKVTVATNMAGRGTDIKLHDDVKSAGGLHVFLTEIHQAERIDWQLIGRSSRQGDPGSYQICVSFDDEILKLGFGNRKADLLLSKYSGRKDCAENLITIFRKSQRLTERKHLVDRLALLKQEEQRQKASYDTGQDPYLTVVR